MDILDIYTKEKIFKILYKSLFDDVINELNIKMEGIKSLIDKRFCEDGDERIYILNHNYGFVFRKFYLRIKCVKHNVDYDKYLRKTYDISNTLCHFNDLLYCNNKIFTVKYFFRGSLFKNIGFFQFYSKFLKGGINPKLTNKIFEANNINFGLIEK